MIVTTPGHGSTIHSQESLKEKSAAVPPALDQRKGDIIGQATSYIEPNTVSVQENDWKVVPKQANAKSRYLRHWTFAHHHMIKPAKSTTTVAPLPKLQPDTVCGRCGCLQISYKPSRGVVSCDRCFTPYQQNDLAAAGWGLEEYRSTEPAFDPPSGLSDFQGDLVNHALTPEVTTLGSHGNDLDDFSWFMAS